MTNVDQFESMFRAAARELFVYERTTFRSVLVVTDLDADGATAFGDRVRAFLNVLGDDDGISWQEVAGSAFQTAEELLKLVEAAGPDLICTYRNLHSSAWRWPYSLGTHLDLLTQHTRVPVLVLPHPAAARGAEHAMENTDRVMAITDHMLGDYRLVNHAARFTDANGTLWLTHIENEIVFDRYLDAISKIPFIDTDPARAALSRQLLKDAVEYIGGCARSLREAGVPLTVEPLVTFGHHLADYRKLIEEHKVDLLVLNTNEEDQLAMHGIAYALAVELRQIPLLLL